MKYITILITLVLSLSTAQLAFGDSHKGAKAKGKEAAQQGWLKRGKGKNKDRG